MWQAMVFYLNRLPNPANVDLTTAGHHAPADPEGGLKVVYPICGAGPGAARIPATSLILPLTAAQCGLR